MRHLSPIVSGASGAIELTRDHVLMPWSTTGAEPPLSVTGAAGARIYDASGRSYLDFTSQLVYSNIGHGHPKMTAAIGRQASQLAVISPAYATEIRGYAARALSDIAPKNLSRVFFTNGGADANENAIRMARHHTGRVKIVSFYNSYHGATGAAINATGDWRRTGNEFGVGHVRVFGPNLYRTMFASASEDEEAERAFYYLEQTVAREGADEIAAIIMEPIVGSSGVLLPPSDYLARVRRLTQDHGIVLIFDEVMTGFGRTGKWFALEHWNVVPDLITFAKGVNSGYVPVGGVLISDQIAATWNDRRYIGGLTYSGHPLAMASILASLEILRDERLLENAGRLGAEVVRPELFALRDCFPLIGDVRGAGLLWALELVQDLNTREPVSRAVTDVIATRARQAGLLVLAVENRIHIAPPLLISESDMQKGLELLREVLQSVV